MPHRGPIRARDLRANIKDMGFEPGVVHTLELLMDEFVHTRQQLRELASIQANIIEQMNRFLELGVGIRDKVEAMRRDQEKGNAIDHGERP